VRSASGSIAVPSEVFRYRDGRLAVSLHDPDGNQWLLMDDAGSDLRERQRMRMPEIAREITKHS
jgi:hypothetical protein